MGKRRRLTFAAYQGRAAGHARTAEHLCWNVRGGRQVVGWRERISPQASWARYL
jgi:hypothetical protein